MDPIFFGGGGIRRANRLFRQQQQDHKKSGSCTAGTVQATTSDHTIMHVQYSNGVTICQRVKTSAEHFVHSNIANK